MSLAALATVNTIDRAQITEFWTWFARVAQPLSERMEGEALEGGQFDDDELLAELDRRIHDVWGFGWELGPGISEPCALVISPGGDADLLEATSAIVAAAPPIAGWEFHPARPPKEWQLIFELQRDDGEVATIDASTWRCVVLPTSAGQVQLLIEAPLLEELSTPDRCRAVEIALDGVLGEQRHLQWVEHVTLTTELEGELAADALPLATLRERSPAG